MWKSIATISFLLLLPRLADAQEPGSPGAPSSEKLEWKDSWRRADWVDAAVIVGGFSYYLADLYVLPRDDTQPSWKGPILLDAPLRDLLRAHVRSDRSTAAQVSDAMLYGSLLHNMVFDNFVVALTLQREPDVAWRMTVANAEAYAITFAVTSLVKSATGRQRPYQAECRNDPEYSSECGGSSSYRSFFSGHASTTATGAGLLCAHHTHMPLYDGGVLDMGACVAGIAMTVLTGAMRMSSDKHWASDVMMGHLVGFSSGYLVPTLLHYTDEVDDKPADVVLLPGISPDSLGVRVIGRM